MVTQDFITNISEMLQKNDSIILDKPIMIKVTLHMQNANINIIPFHIMLCDSLLASTRAPLLQLQV
jgi:hypothetical protein